MTGYQIAWSIIAVAGLGGALALWQLLKRVRWGLLPWLAITVSLTFFLVPVPVPNFPHQLAPAFVVAIFEMFFQIDGQPQASLRVLGLSLGAVALVTVFVYFFAQRRRKNTPEEPGPPPRREPAEP